MPRGRPAPSAANIEILQAGGVPLVSLEEACRGCEHEQDCEDTDSALHEQERIWDPLDLDYDTELIGSLRATSGRTVVIATGKSDWPHTVTDESDSFAQELDKVYQKNLKDISNSAATNGKVNRTRCLNIGGFGDGYTVNGVEREHSLTLLCGSTHTIDLADDDDKSLKSNARDTRRRQSVLIFPDYKLVALSEASNAEDLAKGHLCPRPGNQIKSNLRSYALPHRAIILICSHKRRDKRCHITAPPLIEAFTQAIEALGSDWHVDTRGDNPDLLEAGHVSPMLSEDDFRHNLRRLHANGQDDEKYVGIYKVSHIGGHKFAAQVLIWLPNGVCIWYARVRPRDAAAIIHSTLVEGRVIGDLLRGGVGLAGRQGSNLLQW